MPRILIAECKQEVSTFNPQLSGYDDFKVRQGDELVRYHRSVRNEIGGALDVFDQAGVEIVPAYSAFFITSGGTLAEPAWQRIAAELLACVASHVQSARPSPFTLVVSSRAVNLYDRSFFLAHGQDPRNFDAVVVKSPHCQPHMYAQWCSQMIFVDAPGSSSANLPYLGHTRCRRPIFPLDQDVVFMPCAELFQRPGAN